MPLLSPLGIWRALCLDLGQDKSRLRKVTANVCAGSKFVAYEDNELFRLVVFGHLIDPIAKLNLKEKPTIAEEAGAGAN